MRNLHAKHLIAGLAALSFLLHLPAAQARTCSLDRPPAATLLLPYFEVDLDSASGRTTLFSLNNASAVSILTNVTVWSDLGVPTLWFHVYLTGYDVQTINLRDVLNGVMPRTASRGQDPGDTISPQGSWSQDLDIPSCTGVFPLPNLPGSLVDHLRKSHTGKSSPILEGCAGQNLGDNVARGYVTVDTVNRCQIKNPSEAGYFGPGGMATNQNVLWGDFFLVDEFNNFAQGEDLIRLEADPARFHNGDSTFYGRYVSRSALDAREPLPSIWASRYVVAGAFTGGTDLLVWRESGSAVRAFPCGSVPAPFPLRWFELASFDEQENLETFDSGIGDPPPPPGSNPLENQFGAEANRVKINGSNYPVSFDFGWIFLNLGASPGSPANLRRQAWVGTVSSADGRFSVGYNATPLDSLCSPP
jgi:hypothetical protein